MITSDDLCHYSYSSYSSNAIYPIWFVPDKKPVAGEKK